MSAFRRSHGCPPTRRPRRASRISPNGWPSTWHRNTRRVSRQRVGAGFFLTEQNRFLLTDEKTGELTARGAAIIAHTPMGRFGVPEDLLGAALWLLSPASAFVTGIVVPLMGLFGVQRR